MSTRSLLIMHWHQMTIICVFQCVFLWQRRINPRTRVPFVAGALGIPAPNWQYLGVRNGSAFLENTLSIQHLPFAGQKMSLLAPRHPVSNHQLWQSEHLQQDKAAAEWITACPVTLEVNFRGVLFTKTSGLQHCFCCPNPLGCTIGKIIPTYDICHDSPFFPARCWLEEWRRPELARYICGVYFLFIELSTCDTKFMKNLSKQKQKQASPSQIIPVMINWKSE